MKNIRKLFGAALLIVLVFTVTGCMKLNQSLSLKEDGSGSMSLSIAVSKEMLEDESVNMSLDDAFSDFSEAYGEENVTVETWETDDESIQNVMVTFDNLVDFLAATYVFEAESQEVSAEGTSADAGEVTDMYLEEVSDGTYKLVLAEMGSGDSDDATYNELMMMAAFGLEYHITAEIDVPVVESNASTLEGNIYTWDVPALSYLGEDEAFVIFEMDLSDEEREKILAVNEEREAMKAAAAEATSEDQVLATETVGFTDTDGHWSAENISRLVQRGTVNGYPDGTFNPDGTVTRAEFIKMLMLSISTEEAMPASEGDWYEAYVMFATENQLFEGFDDYGQNATRAEMAEILAKSAGYVGLVYGDDYEDFDPGFSDMGQMGTEEAAYVKKCAYFGLIGGYPDGTFGGDRTITRAETATMLVRLLDMFED